VNTSDDTVKVRDRELGGRLSSWVTSMIRNDESTFLEGRPAEAFPNPTLPTI
jgi:hypothetical protein